MMDLSIDGLGSPNSNDMVLLTIFFLSVLLSIYTSARVIYVLVTSKIAKKAPSHGPHKFLLAFSIALWFASVVISYYLLQANYAMHQRWHTANALANAPDAAGFGYIALIYTYLAALSALAGSGYLMLTSWAIYATARPKAQSSDAGT